MREINKNLIVLACFFLSGICGLVYEVVWARMLTLVFGNTTHAYSTVLTVFMVGLALGSIVFGRLVDRAASPLRIYGLLEIGIGVYAAAFPHLLKLQDRFALLYRPESDFTMSSLALFLFCSTALVVPTVLMGGTVPVLSRYFVENYENRGQRIGQIYALNTFGAVLGCFLTGYVLMLHLGITRTVILGSAINIIIGAVCLALPAGRKADERKTRTKDTVSGEIEAARRPGEHLLLGAFFLSGFTAMFYEVTWSRLLTLILGSSVYAFATMLTTFLFGLALGSYLYSLLAGKRAFKPEHFGAIQLAVGTVCLLILPLFNEMSYWSYLVHFRHSDSYGLLQAIKFLFCFVVMILPTMLFGATFPMVAAIWTRALGRVGREVGQVYFWNTIGSTLGSFTVGFVSIPLIGIRNSIALAIAVNVTAGIALTARTFWNRSRMLTAAVMAAAVLVMAATFFIKFDREALTSQLFLRHDRPATRTEFFGSKHDSLVYYKEGISAIISVHKGGNINLRINGKTDASTSNDMATQILVGHLPFLVNPKERYGNVAVLGMGSGVTAASAAMHPVDRVYQLEIEEAIVKAGGFFSKYNHDVLNNPRVSTVIADGRHFIRNFDGKFDVIISEPSNPWLAGIGNLFSADYYRLSMEKMSDDGVFCQWLQGYSLSPELFKVVLRTFTEVFPYSTFWLSQPGDHVLLGFKTRRDPFQIELGALTSYLKRNPPVAYDMVKIGMAMPYALNAPFLMDDRGIREFAAGSRIHTDDRPILEYLAPRDLYKNTVLENMTNIMAARSGMEIFTGVPDNPRLMAQSYTSMGQFFHLRKIGKEAFVSYDRAFRVDPKFELSSYMMTQLLVNFGMLDSAEFYAKRGLRETGHPQLHCVLGIVYNNMNQFEKAREQYSLALLKDPGLKQAKILLKKLPQKTK